MKINWKVRLKNPVFWMTSVPALIGLIYSLLGAFGIVPSVTSTQLEGWIGTVIAALTTIGVLVDPTTSGMSDSERALRYTCPKDSECDLTKGGE